MHNSHIILQPYRMINCTICREEVLKKDTHPDDPNVCNTCLIYCADSYCMETRHLKKGYSWNTLFRFPNQPYITEMPFCAGCYDSNCYTKCKGCKIVHSYQELTVQAFGDDAPEWEQLFCGKCVMLRLREQEHPN